MTPHFRTVLLLSLSAAACGPPLAAHAASDSPVGEWRTIDDKTGETRAIVAITQENTGELSGKIIRTLDPTIPADRRCTACTDERKNQLLTGLTIIRNMKKDGNHWEGGNILDPASGSVYDCTMKLKKDGQELVVRGFVGLSLLGRSQTWVRN